jgi:hypothetical protein
MGELDHRSELSLDGGSSSERAKSMVLPARKNSMNPTKQEKIRHAFLRPLTLSSQT